MTHVSRITPSEAACGADDLYMARELIVSVEPTYPDIARWWDQKVVPGIISGERIVVIGGAGADFTSIGIIKLGEHAKLCHLSVVDAERRSGVGDAIMRYMIMHAAAASRDIRFTAPSSVWEECDKFFGAYGFSQVCKAARSYRVGDPELVFSARTWDVLAALRRLDESEPRVAL